jgi:hypothetical protein
MPDHTCPYAAALSDDEDANSQNAAPAYSSFDDNESSSSSSPKTNSNAAIVLEARLKCPAFARTCPFRNCNVDDPTSLMEVMKTVPQSHFHILGSNNSTGDDAAVKSKDSNNN